MISRDAFFEQMATLNDMSPPKALRVVALILIAGIVMAAALLWFVPWRQTAFGIGVIQTDNPNQRAQSISALVGGQVKTWHVREGQKMAAGEPILTLTDGDPALIERLENQINAANRRREAQSAALSAEQNNLERQQRLLDEGLTSQRNVESAVVAIENIKTEIAKIDGDLNRLAVERARLSLQTKVAPEDGFITNLRGSGGSTYFKAGEVIADFIPTNITRSAVISVSGLDAPLIKKGRIVTLQFEGWPALLFSGWPGLSRGTFTGVVNFVEPRANVHGRFNVWIQPDPLGAAWPSEQEVRLGSRVQGWVLLEEVRLGYELWRQLNNFPANRKPEQLPQ